MAMAVQRKIYDFLKKIKRKKQEKKPIKCP